MKKTYLIYGGVWVFLYFSIAINAQEMSNEEWNRVNLAQKNFNRLDLNRDGKLNVADLAFDMQPWTRKNLKQWISKKDNATLRDFTQVFQVPTIAWEGVQVCNVEYKRVGNHRLLLDIYLPEKTGSCKLPVMLFIHGGGWENGSKEFHGPRIKVSEMLAKHQIAVVSINYRLVNRKDVFVEDCVIDAMDALRFLNKEGGKFGLDAKRTVVWGTSAGAHLAMMLNHCNATDFKGDTHLNGYAIKPLGAVEWYGPTVFDIDKLKITEGARIESLKKKFALSEQAALDAAERLAPINYVDKNDGPLFIIQGDNDRIVPYFHATQMEKELIKQGAIYQMLMVKNAGHNWSSKQGTDPSVQEIYKSTAEFIINTIKP